MLPSSVEGSSALPGGPCAWGLPAWQGRKSLSWCPEFLRLIGRGRRNLFGLCPCFTGPSGPDNEGKE